MFCTLLKKKRKIIQEKNVQRAAHMSKKNVRNWLKNSAVSLHYASFFPWECLFTKGL